jgi:NAD(P)-dependent dehydrogenase (short-subunit alcohol dehydrogenase family)
MTNIPTIDFTGKVAFVTGAGSGIGRASAIAFAKAGASVTVVDINETGLQQTATEIQGFGGKVLTLVCDVTKNADVKPALEKTVQTFGRLDAAHNNAGIEQPTQPIAELSEELWDRVIAVNLKSVFLCMKHEIEIMLRQGSGAIVNTSSGEVGRSSIRHPAPAFWRSVDSPAIAPRNSASLPPARLPHWNMPTKASALMRSAQASSIRR